MWLFIVLLVRHKNKKMGMAVHLAVAGDVFDGALLCAVPFPTRCLG